MESTLGRVFASPLISKDFCHSLRVKKAEKYLGGWGTMNIEEYRSDGKLPVMSLDFIYTLIFWQYPSFPSRLKTSGT